MMWTGLILLRINNNVNKIMIINILEFLNSLVNEQLFTFPQGLFPLTFSLFTIYLSLKVKRPGYVVEQSPPSIAEIKNIWSYTFLPIHIHGATLTNALTAKTPP